MNEHIKEPETIDAPALDFPIVGIGASAGGLEAVTSMFHQLNVGTGMAFVLVLHLDPNHESLMAELLSRKTHIEVRQIEDGDAINIDCLHVIPPGFSLEIQGGYFKLEKFSEPRGLRRPIDQFFASLAKAQSDKSACVVLSGTGADGSAGLRVVKELGGVCAVQTPDDARYDGMPHSAMSTNLCDFILPADQIIPRLKQFFDGVFRPDLTETSDEILLDVFDVLRGSFGHDFSGYKKSTLVRRLDRRMQVLEQVEPDKYLEMLKDSLDEQGMLLQDFLINVTAFFRDKAEFEALRIEIIEPMIKAADSTDELRIWVPGCSSGQEAYTIAMLIDDVCEELNKRPLIQIFATDIDETMISIARRGVYPVSAFAELPQAYQNKYTIGLDGKFEIVRRIREMVRFSIHNLIQDPPFSKIDLISCRNLLIYLGEELQSDVLPVMHFSLQPGGHLFLGTSENVTRRGELFSSIGPRSRIFKRQNTTKRPHIHFPLGRQSQSDIKTRLTAKMAEELDFPRHQSLDISNLAIYEQYAPPFIRVASDGRILDSSGDLSLFLESRPADERSLQTLARESIRDTVLPIVSDAISEDRRRAIKDLQVHSPFGIQVTDIIIHPMKDETAALIFIVKNRLAPIVDDYAVTPHSTDRRISDLQHDLQATRLMLKSKVEEVETANEELKSSNEEMMSMNEELQSANEELTTANEELKNKIDELTLANADLDNFVQSSDIAMLVLDRAQRIRHVTDAARKIVPVVSSDKGRLLSEFNLNFDGVELLRDVSTTLETGQPIEKTTTVNADGKNLLLRVLPYYFNEDSVEGVTITMVDISDATRLQNDLEEKSQRLTTALRAGRIGLAEYNVPEDMVLVDDELSRQLGLPDCGLTDFDTAFSCLSNADRAEMKRLLHTALATDEPYEVDFLLHIENERERWIRTCGVPLIDFYGNKRVVSSSLDVTAEKYQDLVLREMSHRIKNLFAVIGALIQLAPKGNEATQKYADELLERVLALGSAYDLARKDQSVASVPLLVLLQKLISPHVNGQTVEIKGCDLSISNQLLNTVTLLLHELTTNSLKYGALSTTTGSLFVNWTTDKNRTVTIEWREEDENFSFEGAGEGFGSELLERGVRQLKGNIERTFFEGGMLCILRFEMSVE